MVNLAAPGYPPDHWINSPDPEAVLAAAARQAALSYSRNKNLFLFELLGDLTGARVLDYGCGAGVFAMEAAARGADRVVCLDAGLPGLRAAALLGERRGLASRMRYVAASDGCSLGKKARFTAIVLRDVIEHVPDDAALLERLAGLLSPGGRLVVSTQNSWSLNHALEGGIRRHLLGQKNWMGWDATHLRFYSPGSLTRLLARAGLTPFAWRSAYVIPHKLPLPGASARKFLRIEPLSACDRLLGRVYPFSRLGFCLMAGARK